MSFKLVVANKVRFSVKGVMPNEAGVFAPFEFTLEADRMGSTELQGLATDATRTVADVLADKVKGWQGVTGPDGEPVPFGPEALGQLLDVVGMAPLVLGAYVAACGAKAKN